jgi:hypothetical protein
MECVVTGVPEPDERELAALASQLLDDTDHELITELARLYDLVDPVPEGLMERVGFTLTLAHMEIELARLVRDYLEPAGVRGEERARTVTFTAESLSVMVTITPTATGQFRLDGWLAPGGAMRVELRKERGSDQTRTDDDGRFEFDHVPAGLAQLVFHPTEGGEARLMTPVVTPAIEL